MENKKQILFISRIITKNGSGGLRHANIIKYLDCISNLTVLNVAQKSIFYSKKNSVVRLLGKMVRKLPLLPDFDILLLHLYKKEIKKIFKEKNFDTVIIGILPFSFLKLAKFIHYLDLETKIIIDLTDPITCNARYYKFSKLKKRHLKKFEEKFFKYIDVLVVLNKEIKDYYDSLFLNTIKTVVIEQGFSSHDIRADNSWPKWKESISLLYAGNFYKDIREPFELYKAIDQIEKKISLTIYGQFNKRFRPPTSKKFFFGGRIDRNTLMKKYMEHDIIVFIDNKESLQIPGKTYEILSLNKPILFIYYAKSPTMRIVSNFEGVFFAKNNKEEISLKIHQIISEKKMYERNLSNYTWENIFHPWKEIV